MLLSADRISQTVSLFNIMNGIVPTQAKQTNHCRRTPRELSQKGII